MKEKKGTSKLPDNFETDFEVRVSNPEIAGRLKIAAKEAGGADQLADKSGIARRTLGNYLSGRNEPKASGLVAISRASGFAVEWLATGEGEPQADQVNETGAEDGESDFALVPRYDVAASAGHGSLVQSEQVVDYLAFRRAWLAREGLQEGKLALIQARGDSMSPAVESGDLLLVDLREQTATDDGIYVLCIENHLVAKRLQRMLKGEIYIKSDNEAYETQIVSLDGLNSLNIVGRVVWVARRI